MMSTTKRRTWDEINILIAILDRREGGATIREIAAEFGLTTYQVQFRLWPAARCRAAQEELSKEPTDIEALEQIGRLVLGYSVSFELKAYDVTTLTDLVAGKWSRAEILSLRGIGKLSVDHIEEVVREFGLALHPNRKTPLVHEMNEDEKRCRASREKAEQERAAKWNDREFVIEQARRVVAHFRDAYNILKDGRDDEQFLSFIVDALQRTPRYTNGIAEHRGRMEAAEQEQGRLEAERDAALEARETANRRLVELAKEAGAACGKVIVFPLSHARGAEARL
jgi:hypothetical protein